MFRKYDYPPASRVEQKTKSYESSYSLIVINKGGESIEKGKS